MWWGGLGYWGVGDSTRLAGRQREEPYHDATEEHICLWEANAFKESNCLGPLIREKSLLPTAQLPAK